MNSPSSIKDLIEARLEALQAGNRLSAWSLIVSFMGDAISPRGGLVSAGAVQALMARLGIGHGAVRTAVSRLSADGWIERQREGRNSFYRLSPEVTETVRAAEARIYAWASLLPSDTPMTLVIGADAFDDAAHERLMSLDALLLDARIALCFTAPEDLPRALHPPVATLAATSFVDPGVAGTERIAEARQWADLQVFCAAYEPVLRVLDRQPELAGEDAMALRCLLIHEWRRIALKILPVPPGLLLAEDPESRARRLAAAIYDRLKVASEAWLDAHACTRAGPLPPRDQRFAERFQQDYVTKTD
ncbi:MAG: PaaX family transcriptional regulator C-terminal domain-containing protein [Hoeflea sp.]|uniref:PaaX family transcriptional regulator C-terminal domain-containing protein n=1 Tax=Hoeflea sp. TaxID=1940281 RepID=UPI0032F00E6A